MSLYPYPVAHLHQPPATGLPVAGSALWLDCLRSGSMWQDIGRTTAATNGQAVASYYDPTTGRAATMSTTGARPVISGDAPALDGLDDRLALPEFLSSPAATVFAVVRPSSVSALQAIFWDYGNSLQTIFLALNTGGAPWFRVRDTSSNVIDAIHPGTLSANVTAVIAGRIAGTTGTVWRGLSSHAATNTAYQDTIWTNTEVGPPTIGSFPGGGSSHFAGAVRSLAVYTSALTDQQVADTITWLAARHSVTL